MDESPQTKLLGIRIFSMDLLFSWPCSQRFWTVGDFWKNNENLWRPAADKKSLSLDRDDTRTYSIYFHYMILGLFYVILLLLYYSVLVALGKYSFNCLIQVCVMVLIVKL